MSYYLRRIFDALILAAFALGCYFAVTGSPVTALVALSACSSATLLMVMWSLDV